MCFFITSFGISNHSWKWDSIDEELHTWFFKYVSICVFITWKNTRHHIMHKWIFFHQKFSKYQKTGNLCLKKIRWCTIKRECYVRKMWIHGKIIAASGRFLNCFILSTLPNFFSSEVQTKHIHKKCPTASRFFGYKTMFYILIFPIKTSKFTGYKT